jgi:hypothetical protein
MAGVPGRRVVGCTHWSRAARRTEASSRATHSSGAAPATTASSHPDPRSVVTAATSVGDRDERDHRREGVPLEPLADGEHRRQRVAAGVEHRQLRAARVARRPSGRRRRRMHDRGARSASHRCTGSGAGRARHGARRPSRRRRPRRRARAAGAARPCAPDQLPGCTTGSISGAPGRAARCAARSARRRPGPPPAPKRQRPTAPAERAGGGIRRGARCADAVERTEVGHGTGGGTGVRQASNDERARSGETRAARRRRPWVTPSSPRRAA